jgi:hypothetical protein
MTWYDGKIHVYKSKLTGHWIVDKSGTKERPGYYPWSREGFRHWEDAIAWAFIYADERPRQWYGS